MLKFDASEPRPRDFFGAESSMNRTRGRPCMGEGALTCENGGGKFQPEGIFRRFVDDALDQKMANLEILNPPPLCS